MDSSVNTVNVFSVDTAAHQIIKYELRSLFKNYSKNNKDQHHSMDEEKKHQVNKSQ